MYMYIQYIKFMKLLSVGSGVNFKFIFKGHLNFTVFNLLTSCLEALSGNMCPILTMSEEQSVQTGSHIKVISWVSRGHIRVRETRATVQGGKLFTPAMYCSLIWCATQTAKARTEKVIVNGLFVFMEFAYRRWTVGSDPDSHFFPLWDERERDASGPKGKKGDTWAKKWPGCTRKLNWGSWKITPMGIKGEVCVIMHWTQSSHHLKPSYCVIACIEMKNPHAKSSIESNSTTEAGIHPTTLCCSAVSCCLLLWP